MSLDSCLKNLGFSDADAAEIRSYASQSGGEAEGVEAYIKTLEDSRESLRDQLEQKGFDVGLPARPIGEIDKGQQLAGFMRFLESKQLEDAELTPEELAELAEEYRNTDIEVLVDVDAAELEAARARDERLFAGPEGSGTTTLEQRANHGTPSLFDPETGAPFGRFRLEFMGTGEGNQVFGWGMYFAMDWNIAENYRKKLTQDIVALYDRAGELLTSNMNSNEEFDIQLDIQKKLEAKLAELPFGAGPDAVNTSLIALKLWHSMADRLLHDSNKDMEQSLKEVARWVERYTQTLSYEVVDSWKALDGETVSDDAEAAFYVQRVDARSWTLRGGDPEFQMLGGDRFLTRAQAEQLKAAAEAQRDMVIEKIAEVVDEDWVGATIKRGDAGHVYEVEIDDDAIATFLDNDTPFDQQAPVVRATWGDIAHVIDLANERATPWQRKRLLIPTTSDTGEYVYEALVRAYKLVDEVNAQRLASEFFGQRGVQGIKFLDANSRDADVEDPNYNFVVWTPKALQITARDGVPVPQNIEYQQLYQRDQSDERTITMAEAQEKLERWRKWRPARTKAGKQRGAPKWINDSADRNRALRKLKALIKQLVAEGEEGRYWYEDASEYALQVTNGDVVEAEKFVQLLAIYSPQSNVWVNTLMAVKAYNMWKAGVPASQYHVRPFGPEGSHTGDVAAIDVLYNNGKWEGRKTNSFYVNLMHHIIKRATPDQIAQMQMDPELMQRVDEAVTVDMWIKRAAGYENDATANDMGNGAYSYQEGLLSQAALELNDELLRQTNDPESVRPWLPHQVQAAMWTAIKARMQDDAVVEETYRKSLKKKLAVKDENGNPKPPKDAEKLRAHRAIWRAEALKKDSADVKANIATAKMSFSDMLGRLIERVTWESKPSDKLGLAINGMSRGAQEAYNSAARGLFVSADGRDVLADLLGIGLAWSEYGLGGYDGAMTPNSVTSLVPTKPQGKFARKEVDLYARAIQYIFQQDAVPWFRADAYAKPEPFKLVHGEGGAVVPSHGAYATAAEATAGRAQMIADLEAKLAPMVARAKPGKPKTKVRLEVEERLAKAKATKVQGGNMARGVNITLPAALDEAGEQKFFDALREALGPDAGFTQYGDNQIAIMNLRFEGNDRIPEMPDAEFVEKVEAVANLIGGDPESFWAESDYGPEHDWSKDPTGEGLLNEGSLAGQPDLHGRLRDWRAQATAIREDIEANPDLYESGGRADASGRGRLGETEVPSQPGPVRLEQTDTPRVTIGDNGRERIPGLEKGSPGAVPGVHEAAAAYAKAAGIPYRRQARYAPVDVERAKRIAQAFEQMEHAPDDPAVAASYAAMIAETLAQYQHIKTLGYTFEPMTEGMDDPYPTVREVLDDLADNKHMWFFPTDYGYGMSGPVQMDAQAVRQFADPNIPLDRLAEEDADYITKLADSIAQEGQLNPIVIGDVSGTKMIKDGHHRLLALESLGLPIDVLDETQKGIPDAEIANNPLLAWTDETLNGQRLRANDVFRIVHDFFGHGPEGALFRARGEENAWQSHIRLYSDAAAGAVTSETRGQNSWLNFGPHGEANRTAATMDTVFAEQKVGLMPEWTWTEGRAADMPAPVKRFYQGGDAPQPERDSGGLYSAVEKAILEMNLPAWKKTRTVYWIYQKGTQKREPDSLQFDSVEEAKEMIIDLGGEASLDTWDIRPIEMTGKANGADIWAKLKKSPGIKKEELEWLGIEQFLNPGDTPIKLTRSQTARFVRASGVKVETVVAEEGGSSGDSEIQWFGDGVWNEREAYEDDIEEAMNEFDYGQEQAGPLDAAAFMESWIIDNIGQVVDNYEPATTEAEWKELTEIDDPADQWAWLKDNKLVDEADVRHLARADAEQDIEIAAEQAYLEDPMYIARSQDFHDGSELIIVGNDERGYTLRTGWSDWDIIDSGFPDEDYARERGEEYAMEHDLLVDEDDVNRARWKEYAMDGDFDNYRELKFTLPEIGGDFYETNHFPDRNIVAFARVDDRELDPIKGALRRVKTYFIDELQSDWHSAGRKQGYKTGANVDDLYAERVGLKTAFEKRAIRHFKQFGEELGGFSVSPENEAFEFTFFLEDEFRSRPEIISSGEFEVLLRKVVGYGFKVPEQFAGFRKAKMAKVIEFAEAIEKVDKDWLYSLRDTFSRIDEINKEISAQQQGVTNAPFKDDAWLTMALKRTIVDAVEGGYEAIGWPNAKELEDRWSSSFDYGPQYDKKMPSIIKKLTKSQPTIIAEGGGVSGDMIGEWKGIEDSQINDWWRGFTRDEQDQLMLDYREAHPNDGPGYWIIPITDELRQRVEREGFSLFQQESEALGATTFKPGETVIELFQSADMSTMLHETGHVLVHLLESIATQPDAPQSVKDNFQALLDYVGASSAAELDVNQHGEAARDKQEKLARAFEAYLMQGKAPSTRLRSAFATFKEWLLQVYTRLRNLDARISPDISEVFDRLLATDQEIAQVREVNAMGPSASPSIVELMTPAERDRYLATTAEADDLDVAEAARIARELELRTQEDWWEAELAKTRERVSDELWAMPAYRAWRFLAQGELPPDPDTPIAALRLRNALKGRRISKASLLEAGLTQEELNGIPRGTRRVYTTGADGVDVEVMAMALGFESGVDLANELRDLAPPDDAIEAESQARMLAKHGDPNFDGRREESMQEALYHESRRKVIEAELNTLAKATGQAAMGRSVARRIADEMFASTPVSDLLKPMKYQAASVRHAREAERLAAAGDTMGAYEAKRRQLLNHEMFRRALKAKEKSEAIRRRLLKLKSGKIDPNKVDPEFIQRVKSLLEIYQLSGSLKQFQDRTGMFEPMANEVMAFLEARIAEGIGLVMPAELFEQVSVDPDTGVAKVKFKLRHWRQLTMSELEALDDVTTNLMKAGRDNSAEEKQRLKEEHDALAAGIMVATNTDPRKREGKPLTREETQKLEGKTGFFAYHRKLESMMVQLDGFQPMGPMWKAVFWPLALAQGKRNQMVRDMMDEFDKVFGVYSFAERHAMTKNSSRKPVPGMDGAGFTHEQRLMIALNAGNESSIEALLKDKDLNAEFNGQWNAETLQAVLAQLDERDADVVQGIFNLVNQFWFDAKDADGNVIREGIATMERRTTGVVPKKVEAKPMVVGGKAIAGGYYPLVYDTHKDNRARADAAGDMMKQVQGGLASRAHTAHGHTNERVGSGGRVVRLDIGSLMGHLDQVSQDLTHREAIAQVAKLFDNSAIQAAIKESMGQTYLNDMKKILVSVANGGVTQHDEGPVLRMARNARLNISAAIMALNVRVLLTQPLGLFNSIEQLTPKWMIRGMWQFYSRPDRWPEIYRDVFRRSPMMRDRARGMTRELDDINQSVRLPNVKRAVQSAAMMPMVWIDAFSVAMPTWLGAFERARAGRVKGVASDEVSAAAYADQLVRRTQGTGGALHQSLIQQDGEAMKLVTLFGSYFNTTYQLQSEAYQRVRQAKGITGKAAQVPNLLYSTTLLQIIPGVMGAMLMEAWPRPEPGEDEDEAMAIWMMQQVAMYWLGQLFIVRDGVSAMKGFGFSPSPVLSLGDLGADVTKDIWEASSAALKGEDPNLGLRSAKNLIRLVGYGTGIPGTSQIVRWLDYGVKAADDDLKNPPRNELERAQQIIFTGDR